MAKTIKPKRKKASVVSIRKQRQAKVDKEFEKQKDRVLRLLREHIPGLFESINVANYDVLMPQFIDFLQKRAISASQFKQDKRIVSRFIEAGNKSGVWSLSVPAPTVSIIRGDTLKNLRWFDDCRKMTFVYQWFQNCVSTGELPMPRWLRVIMSAMFWGGLCQVSALVQLAKQLGDPQQKHLHQYDDWCWFDLCYQQVGQPTNLLVADEKWTYKRFIPDSCTLGFYHAYQAEPDRDLFSTEITTIFLYQQLRKYIPEQYALPSNFEFLLRAAIGVTEHLPNVRLNQAMMGVAISRTKNCDLPPEAWQRLLTDHHLTNNRSVTLSELASITSSATQNSITKKRRKPGLQNGIPLFSILTKVLRADASGRKKRTLDDALAEMDDLQFIDPTELPITGQILFQWVRMMLLNNSLKLSSVRRYFNSIASHWICYIRDEHSELESDELYDVYIELLDSYRTQDAKGYAAARLESLHLVAVRDFGWPMLMEALPDSNGEPKHVRSNFINEALFSSVIQTIDRIQDCSEPIHHQLKVMAILTYRCGLRLTELLKLQLKDLESSEEGWLFVRNNRYDDNKNTYSRRKIPLWPLLTNGECKVVEPYIGNRRAQSHSCDELLFHQEQSVYTKWDKSLVSRIFITMLRANSGDDSLVFHHFRHSAMYRIHLIVEGEMKLCEWLTPYSLAEQENIKALIAPNSAQDRHAALAAFAGHESPKTTFFNYLHGFDILMFQRVEQRKYALTSQQLTALFTISPTMVTRRQICDQNSHADLRQLRQTLLTQTKTSTLKAPKQTSVQLVDTAVQQYTFGNLYTYHRMLEDHEAGVDVQELVFRYRLDLSLITRLIASADALNLLISTKGKALLKNKVATRPFTINASKQLQTVLLACRKLNSEDKNELRWLVKFAVTHMVASKAYIKLTNVEDCKRFCLGLRQIKADGFAELHYQSRGHKKEDLQWQQAVQAIELHLLPLEKTPERETKGRAKLLFRDPSDKYATNAMRFLFHNLAIILFRPEQISAWN
jgi:integrase